MLAVSTEWTGEAYDEFERILKETIESLNSTLAKNLNRASRDERKIDTLRAQITRIQKSHAETVRQAESRRAQLTVVQFRLTALRAELAEREQSLLSFLRKKEALRLEVSHLATTETQSGLELNSLEDRRNLIERDRDGSDRVGQITILESQLEDAAIERT